VCTLQALFGPSSSTTTTGRLPTGVEQHATTTNDMHKVIKLQARLSFGFGFSWKHPVSHCTGYYPEFVRKCFGQLNVITSNHTHNTAQRKTHASTVMSSKFVGTVM
jgi:hypothetical protein